MNTALNRARLLITTAWVGSIWTIGYLVAPTLFKALADQALAGTIAGQLFMVEAWFSVVCSVVLIGVFLAQRKRFPRLIFGMLICTVFGYFALHPYMASLRELGLSDPDVKWKFGALHGLSSGIYLMQSILGAMLVLDELTVDRANTKKEPGIANPEHL
jgi:hypothetical protein